MPNIIFGSKQTCVGLDGSSDRQEENKSQKLVSEETVNAPSTNSDATVNQSGTTLLGKSNVETGDGDLSTIKTGGYYTLYVHLQFLGINASQMFFAKIQCSLMKN